MNKWERKAVGVFFGGWVFWPFFLIGTVNMYKCRNNASI